MVAYLSLGLIYHLKRQSHTRFRRNVPLINNSHYRSVPVPVHVEDGDLFPIAGAVLEGDDLWLPLLAGDLNDS
jgi:hypothetical protein